MLKIIVPSRARAEPVAMRLDRVVAESSSGRAVEEEVGELHHRPLRFDDACDLDAADAKARLTAAVGRRPGAA
ncbi:MAG: hypothetical protein ACREQ9_14135 [Candidatus Binatia bacterium]